MEQTTRIINFHKVEKISNPIRLSDYANGIFEQLPSRKSVKKALKRQEILVNGSVGSSAHWVKNGDLIELKETEIKVPKIFELDLEVIFEDETIAVINKPAGFPVSGNLYQTIQNALPANLKNSSLPDALKFPLPVHRLDAQTSGLLLIAKTLTARIELGNMFEKKEISKTYHAIVVGEPHKEKGVIKFPIENKASSSHFEKLKTIPSLRNNKVSLLRLSPKTGRTHQLRIHCAESGYPIVGDKLYGKQGSVLKDKGLFLVATGIQFFHPVSKKEIHLEIDLPHKFESLLEREERRWLKFKG